MTASGGRAPQRVAPLVIPEGWAAPERPQGAAPEVQDAYRQLTFQLASELRLFTEGMNLQVRIMRDSSGSRYRTLRLAAMSMYWSRAFQALADAAMLASRGSYASCPALVRGACEAIAAEIQAGGEEHGAFVAWLNTALAPNERHRATDIGLGTFLAGSTLATEPLLGSIYRATAELSRTHFGATIAEVAPESNRERLLVTFADRTFHYGWAQLILDWLIALSLVQLRLASAETSPFGLADETRAAYNGFASRAGQAIADPSHCAVQEIMEDGQRRFLIVNFRRQSTGAPRKLLL
jgi:hypothetical protein